MPKFAVVSFTDETPSVTLTVDPSASLPFVFEGGEFIVSDVERTRFPAATVSGIAVETRKLSPKRDALTARVDHLKAEALAALYEFAPELEPLTVSREDTLVYVASRVMAWNTAADRLRATAQPKARKPRVAATKTEEKWARGAEDYLRSGKAPKAPKAKAKKGA